MHQLLLGREPFQTILWLSKENLFMKNNKLRVQNNSTNPNSSYKSKLMKKKWRILILKTAFKGLQSVLMIMQIIKLVCDFFKM